MDLIYTDRNRNDVGVLKDYTFDLAFGSDENDFELTLDITNHCCQEGCIIYIEDTEYGGIVDGLKVKNDKLVYKGRTWHGIFGTKVLEPNEGLAYLTVKGEANEVLGTLIERIGLSELFVASNEDSGLTIPGYTFDRYTDAYTGITKMLSSVGAKLKFTFKTDKVVVSALPLVDYSKDEQFDNDQVEMDIEKTYNTVNHLICLGRGELLDRQIIHLYVDANGNISDTKTFVGLQEVTEVFDYPNAESLEDLRTKGIEKLKSQASKDKVEMDFAAEEVMYDVGDIVGAKEILTGIFANEKITKKIVTITQGSVNIQYKVGE